MIKAIVFDFAGVLVTPEGFNEFSKELSLESGVDSELIHRVFKKYWDELKVSKIGLKKALKFFLLDVGLKANQWRDIRKRLCNYHEPNLGVLSILSLLKENYNLYIISNYDTYLFRKYSWRLKFWKYFKKYFISDKVGYAKPGTEIYQYFLKKTGYLPEECLFIDDKKENVLSANKLGFNVIQYTSFSSFKSELKKFLK